MSSACSSWSEVPVYWLVAWSNPDTLATARNMLAENILRDRNRASIAIWSVANETPVSDARNTFLRTLVGDVRRLDDTRLVSAALLVERSKDAKTPTMTMADPLAEVLDVLAINTYNGWYTNDRLTDLPGSVWKVPADKPLVFSEFGADARAGFHDLTGPQKFSRNIKRTITARRSRWRMLCRRCAACRHGSSRTSARRAGRIRISSRAGTARSLFRRPASASRRSMSLQLTMVRRRPGPRNRGRAEPAARGSAGPGRRWSAGRRPLSPP